MVRRSQMDRGSRNVTSTNNEVGDGANVVKFEPGVMYCLNKMGKKELVVRFIAPNERKGFLDINFANFDRIFPCFSQVFAEGFYIAFRGGGINSIRTQQYHLNMFFVFLSGKYGENRRLNVVDVDVDADVMDEYILFLNAHNKRDGNKLLGESKKNIIGVLRAVFKAMRTNRKLKTSVNQNFSIPENPWSLSCFEKKPRESLSLPHLLEVHLACIREMKQTMDDLQLGKKLVEENIEKIPTKKMQMPDFMDFNICLAFLAQAYDGPIPEIKKIQTDYPALYNAISKYRHTFSRFHKYLYSTPRSLISFAIMLDIWTGFNPGTLMGLKRGDVSESGFLPDDLLVAPATTFVGEKIRAGKDQVSSTIRSEDIDSPSTIVENVQKLTARLRPSSGKLQEYLFIFRPISGFNDIISIFNTEKNRTALYKALTAFIDDNNLEKFTLSQLRATRSYLEMLGKNGGLLEAQHELNHASSQTTYDSYTNLQIKVLGNEKLGEIQNTQERWILSDGKRDVRGDKSTTVGAATPGFECLDVYNSPQEGQVQGRMCTAYLSCPICPLAAVDQNSATSLVKLIKLEQHIKKAVTSVHPIRYSRVYQPILKKIAIRLKTFSKKVWEEAENVKIIIFFPEVE